jgi:flagellar hook-associated protein 2
LRNRSRISLADASKAIQIRVKEKVKLMGTSALTSLLSGSNAADAIDLSEILQAATGASTPGIDVTSAVNAAVTAAEGPENVWESQETTLADQASALTQIQTNTTSLDNDMQALNSLTGPLSSVTATSSNSSVVTASAASGSSTGNFAVVVTNLASTASYASTAVASATTDLPAESITITPSGGSATTITTGSGVDTLTDLENAINGDDLGVTASIVTDTTGSRLAIVSNTSGSAGSFAVSSSGGSFGFTAGATGSDASLTVNGIPITSASNTVTGAIPGVTLNLLSASPSGAQASISLAPDTSAVSTAINQFVSDYNTLIGDLNTEFSDTSGSGQGVLAQDPTVQTLQSDLLGALDYTATTGTGSSTAVTSLASLGISVNTDGTLTVNSTTLNSALQNNFSQVQNFFQGSALNGFANSLDQQLTSFISPADGAFTVDLQSMTSENTTLQTDVTNFQNNVIVPLQAQLTSEFNSAEIALQQLPGEIKDVDAELGINSSSSS